MPHLDIIASLLLAIGTCLATNVDAFTVFVPTLLAEPGGGARIRTISGCALGNCAVLGASLATGQLLAAVQPGWIRWFGVVPITVGVVKLLRRQGARADASAVRGVLLALATMCSLGTDNVAIIGPLLWSVPPGRRWLLVAVHVVLVPGVLATLYRCRVARFTGQRLGQRAAGLVAIVAGSLVLAG